MPSQLDDKAAEILTQLQHLAPTAAQTALEAARIDAISHFIGGLISLVVFLVCIITWMRWVLPKLASDDDSGEPVAWTIFFGVLGFFSLIIALCQLCDPWTYVTYFHPELWLAHKIIG